MKRRAPSITELIGGNPAVLLAAVMIVLAGIRLVWNDRTGRPKEAWPDEAQTMLGVIRTVPKETAKTLQMDIRLKGGRTDGRVIRVRLMRKDSVGKSGEEALLPGDIVLLHGTVEPPRNSGNPGSPDFAAILRKQGVDGSLFCFASQWKRTGRTDMSFRMKMLRLRQRLAERYRTYFAGRDLAVLSALTLGDKTMLSADVREIFAETGTSHILALSGLHLGILFGLYNFFLLGRTRRYRRMHIPLCLLGLAGIWGFALLAGLPLSLVRASIMYSLMQTALLLRRDIFSLNNLALAATAILLVWPQALADVGFQLSFLSVLGILLLQPLFPRLPRFGESRPARWGYRICASCYGIMTVSLCAIVATAPLVAYTFHTLPIHGLPASLVAIPLAYPLLFFALLFFLLPFAQAWIAPVLGGLLHVLFAALEWLAGLPSACLTVYPTLAGTLLWYAFILTAYTFMTRRRTWAGICTALLPAVIAAIEIYDGRGHRLEPQLIFYQCFSGAVLHAVERADESYLWSTRPEQTDAALAYVKKTFWQREGIASPTLLRNDTTTITLAYTPHVLQFR
ncbi:MAG: ComEC/Rec2 family competence protein, partial [Alloprevotella sp.]|nr:ComEC/Rec2 family competence protein [Alloprevotella sp.]